MDTFLRLIPKAVNELIFYFTAICSVFFLYRNRKKIVIPSISILIIFMILWRVYVQINSSRYALALVIPFTLLFSFICYKFATCRNIYCIGFLSIFLFVYLFLILKKAFPISSDNLSLYYISDFNNYFSRRSTNILFFLPDKDILRIVYNSNPHRNQNLHYFRNNDQSPEDFIRKYNTINFDAIYSATVKTHSFSEPQTDNDNISFKKIGSIYYQKDKKNTIHYYFIRNLLGAYTIADQTDLMLDSGLLINGGLESVDTPEDSYDKLKKNIKNYSTYYSYDSSILTPVNSYFHSVSVLPDNLPYFNCSNVSPISGNYSAQIRTTNGSSYLFFNQKFFNGSYHYSFLLRGDKFTHVSIVVDYYKNHKWMPIQDVSFYIPDSNTYKLEKSFSVKDLKEGDYFILGANISSGEAFLDNFYLQKTDD